MLVFYSETVFMSERRGSSLSFMKPIGNIKFIDNRRFAGARTQKKIFARESFRRVGCTVMQTECGTLKDYF